MLPSARIDVTLPVIRKCSGQQRTSDVIHQTHFCPDGGLTIRNLVELDNLATTRSERTVLL